MKKFRTGNVVKSYYGGLVIITNVRGTDENPYYDWVSFDSSNCSGGSYHNTERKEEYCYDECGHICEDPECSVCNGTGKYIDIRYGMDSAKYLADNVKDYILKGLTKNFDF